MRLPKKLTIGVIKERVKTKSPNTMILSDEYINAKTKLRCRCKSCDYEWEAIWDSLNRGRGCPDCSGNQLKTIEEIKEYVSSNSNCELLSKSYTNLKENLIFKCECGKEFERNFNDFRRKNKNCPECSYKNTGKINSVTDDEIKGITDSRGHKLLKRFSDKHFTKIDLMDDKGYKYRMVYTNYKHNNIGTAFGKRNFFFKDNIKNYFKQNAPNFKLESIYDGDFGLCVTVVCDSGHRESKHLQNFLRGVRCQKCFYKNNTGENHPNYNENLTDEDRYSRRYLLHGKDQKKWAREVHSKCEYKCVICLSDRKLEAHHLESWNSNKELRFTVDNGVTLCNFHHNEFHKTYGYGNNTKEQFEQFKNDYALQHA